MRRAMILAITDSTTCASTMPVIPTIIAAKYFPFFTTRVNHDWGGTSMATFFRAAD
jgi:hypothetical protein